MNPLQTVRSWFSPKPSADQLAMLRAAPIDFSPGTLGNFFGSGIASNQAPHDTLLAENLGVADMATRAIANRVATLNPQVKVSRQTSKGTLEDEVLDDHVLKVLLDFPHKNFTRRMLYRLTAQYIVTVGEAYWLKIGNAAGKPAALQPMPPQRVEPIIDGGIITGYRVLDGSGRDHSLPANEVIRFWFPDPETLYTSEGYLSPNSVNTDAHRFAGEHLRSRYQTDAIPPILLKGDKDATPPSDPQWKRWQDDFQKRHHRRLGTNQGVPGALPTGWDAIVIAMSSGADITPLLDYWQSNQLMNFGVPASVLGRVVSGDRSSAEVNQFVFDLHTILPIAEMMADAITLQLAVDFDPALKVEFEQFVSADKAFDLSKEAQDLKLKVRSPKQILRDRNLDQEDAPWGEFPVGTLAEEPYTGEAIELDLPEDDAGALFEPEEDAEEEAPRVLPPSRWKRQRAHFSPEAEWQRVLARERKFRPRFERAMRSIFESQRKETIKRLRASLPDEDRMRSPVDLDSIFSSEDWIEEFRVKTSPIRQAAYLESGAEALSGIGLGQSFEFTPTVNQILRGQDLSLIVDTGATTQNKLRKEIIKSSNAGEGVDQLTARFNKVFGVRRRNARTIARTELGKATQNAQIEGFRQSGVVEKKRWNDSGDTEVRDTHFGSVIDVVLLGEVFTLADGVTTAMHPLDPTLPVGEVANCRCFVTPEFEEVA